MLGWEVGTFEFTSPRILALNYPHHAALKMRTGGSSGRIGKTQSHRLDEGDGYFWDLTVHQGKNAVRLPVKYRYRSPIIFEFHLPQKRHADAYAMIWLQHLIDNEDTPINLPIWRTKKPARLVQNYVTEDNLRAKIMPGFEDVTEIGRLQFRARFKAGTDESHGAFVVDNNTRETFETWEACMAEGVRTRMVEKELPERVQQLHDESLTEGRDVLKAADSREKTRWLSKDGADWSGAFGHDPKAYMDSKGRKRREPGAEEPLHDPIAPDFSGEEDMDDDEDDGATEDLGAEGAGNLARPSSSLEAGRGAASTDTGRNSAVTQDTNTNGHLGRASTDLSKTESPSAVSKTSTMSSKQINKQNKRSEERHHRGLMQWKPARNAKFAKDEAVIGLRGLKHKMTGGLDGRKPDVETEA